MNKEYIKKYIKEHWLEIVLCFLAGVQILYLVMFNLTRLPYESNYDSSCAYAQIVEMWKQKKIVLEDWSYQTTLGIDSPVLLGALFYGIFKNAFTAFGLANIVTVIMYIFLVYDILKQGKAGNIARLIVIVFLLTPYTTGQLGYMPMLFTSAGSYAYKLLVPLLLIDILIRSHQGKKIKNYWYLLAAVSVFVILTAVSSGEYILLCGIFPLIAYEIFYVLMENDWRKVFNPRIGILIAESILYIIGVKIGARVGIDSRGSSMTLTPAADFPAAVAKCFVGIFELFGGITDDAGIVVTELFGLMYMLRFVLAVCVISSWIYMLVYLKKSREYRELTGMITFTFVINIMILIFADVNYASSSFEYRYHLISMVPMILLTGPVTEILLKKKYLLAQTIVGAGILFLVLTNGYGYKNYLMDCYNRQEDMQAITSLAEKKGVGLIITIGKEVPIQQMGRTLRCVNPDVEVSTWNDYCHGQGWGASTHYHENSNYEGKIMLLMTMEEYQRLPEYLAKQMQYIESFGEFQLYYSEKNILDANTDIPEKGRNIDLIYSPGYSLTGKMLGRQTIEITGKEKNFLRSGKKRVYAEKFDLKISYEMKKGTGAWLLVTDPEGNVLRKEYFDPNKNELYLKDITIESGVEWVRYLFRGNKRGKIKINTIESIAKPASTGKDNSH